MKTLQELYSEVLKSEVLKKSFTDAVQNDKVEDFLKANGCEASKEEFTEFLKEQQTRSGELSDDELSNVAGGCNKEEVVASICGFGVICAVQAIDSAVRESKDPDLVKVNGEILCASTDKFFAYQDSDGNWHKS